MEIVESSIKEKGLSEKVENLITEFGLDEPTHSTLETVQKLLQTGLPLTKSITFEAFNYLLEHGALLPAKDVDKKGSGFNEIYTSLVLSKSYGPIALTLKPEVLARGDFTAYAVDHSSTYVGKQTKNDSLDEEKRVMDKYSLSPDEFKEFYPYVVASLTDHWEELDGSPQYEQKMRFLTFDITVPKIALEDIDEFFIKDAGNGWGEKTVVQQRLNRVKEMSAQKGLSISNIPARNDVYQELEINNASRGMLHHFVTRYKIPEDLLPAMTSVS